MLKQHLKTDEHEHGTAGDLRRLLPACAKHAVPIYRPAAENAPVTTPMTITENQMLTCMNAKLTPTANASMLHATASGSIWRQSNW